MYQRLYSQQTRFVVQINLHHYTYLLYIQLCSVLSDYKEGYSALKREGWDTSYYTRAAKDTGYSLEFEPRGITTKDFRTSSHSKSSKKRREKEYSKSATSLADRARMELVSRQVIQYNGNVFYYFSLQVQYQVMLQPTWAWRDRVVQH